MADLTRLGNIATSLETLAGVTPSNALRLEATEEAKLQRIYNALTVLDIDSRTALADLADVKDSLSPASGHSLVYDGTSWTSGTVSGSGAALNFDDLLDVAVPSPTTGDGLVWNGSTWVNSSTVVTDGDIASFVTLADLGTYLTSSDLSTFVSDGELSAHTSLSSGVHGATGTIVGTSDTQTLTNKTFGDDTTFLGDIVIASPGDRITIGSGVIRWGSGQWFIEDGDVNTEENHGVGKDLYVGTAQNKATTDSAIFFTSATNEYIKWESTTQAFETSEPLEVLGTLTATDGVFSEDVVADGIITANSASSVGEVHMNSAKRGFYVNVDPIAGAWARGFVYYDNLTLLGGFHGFGTAGAMTYNHIGPEYNGVGLTVKTADGFVGINDTSPSYELDVSGDARVTGELRVDGDIKVNAAGPDGDSTIYFYNASTSIGEELHWDDVNDRFELSDALYVANRLEVGGDRVTVQSGILRWGSGQWFFEGGDVNTAANHGVENDLYVGTGQAKASVDTSIFFTASTNESLKWDFTTQGFILSDDLDVTGVLDASSDVQINGVSVGLETDVQEFTANGTWTKPTGAIAVRVICVGGGGGGGGGAGNPTGDSGGGGAAGGSLFHKLYDAADLSATEAVVVGAGGAGGAGGSNAFGSNGVLGGTTSFGSTKVAALGGRAGSGGRDASGTAGATQQPTTSIQYAMTTAYAQMLGGNGGAGDDGAAGAGGVRSEAGSGGGGGGGSVSGVLETAGGAGGGGYDSTGSGSARSGGGSAGAPGGNDGTNGAAATAADRGGSGGGGGGGSITGGGGNGASGGIPGGGGGGGGAAHTGNTGGTGGTGARGVCWVITYR